MILWFTEKILGEFGISNADYLCVTALLTLWWSVWAFNPTLYSPTAHIQSEIQGSFSVVSGLKLNKSDSGNCGHLNIYRWRMKVQVPRLADGCTVIHFMWLTWWHTLWGFNGDCRLNSISEAFVPQQEYTWRMSSRAEYRAYRSTWKTILFAFWI